MTTDVAFLVVRSSTVREHLRANNQTREDFEAIARIRCIHATCCSILTCPCNCPYWCCFGSNDKSDLIERIHLYDEVAHDEAEKILSLRRWHPGPACSCFCKIIECCFEGKVEETAYKTRDWLTYVEFQFYKCAPRKQEML